MLKSRWVIFGVPVSLVLVCLWAAYQATESQRLRLGNLVVASGEGVTPTLNPYLPACEVDRQVTALVHAPLLRIGKDGSMEGGLARGWTWSQQTSFWFANTTYAKQALKKIQDVAADSWSRWHLASADVIDNELLLKFSDAGSGGGIAIHQLVAEYGPLPVETIRVDLNESAWPHHEYFMQHAVEKSQVKEVWFDGATAYEVRVSGESLRFFEELSLYYQNLPALQARLRIVAKTPMLERPALQMPLRDSATFHTGNPVTSADVERTVKLVLAQPWPVQGREILKLIQSWDSSDPKKVRMTFREVYGPALTAFVGLPILPASWIETQGNELAAVRQPFKLDPPPGAGPFRILRVEAEEILLRRAETAGPAAGGRMVEFRLDQSPASIRLGFAMKRVGLFWPDTQSVSKLVHDPGVAIRSAPPRNRLQVIWNCRKSLLSDPRVREILGQAVDRQSLVQEFVQGQGQIHEGIFRPGLWYAPQLPLEPFDRLKSRESLYEMGWIKGADGYLTKDGKPFRIELLTLAGNPDRLRLAQRLKESWDTLGVETVIVEASWDDMLGQRLRERRFDAVLVGLDYDLAWDPWPFWHSSEAARGMNFAGITDPTLDTLLSALRSEFEPVRVPALAQAVEERLLELHPFLPLFSGGSPVAVRRDALPAIDQDETATFQDLRQSLESSSQP